MSSKQTSIASLLFATLVALGLVVEAQPVSAQAVAIPGITAVGSSSAPVSVTVALPSGGTIATVEVLGEGIPNVNFTGSGGTCAANGRFLAGQSCTLNVVFAPASPGIRNGAVVLLDSNRHVLGSQLLTASATGSVGVFVPGIINTVAGGLNWVYSQDGVPAVGASIFLPYGIAVDARGNLFIADSSNNRIRRVDAATGLISTYAGNGISGSGGDNGPATAANLNNPTSVALDPAGNLYIADSGNSAVRRVDAFSGTIGTVAGTITQPGYSGDNGTATAATLNGPKGISFDGNGNLYIADTGNNAIRLLSANNGKISTVAGTGAYGFAGDGGLATAAELNAPWSATPIPSSTPGVYAGFYIADQNNNRIRKVDASGNISTIAGSTSGYSGDNGPALQAQLAEPASVLIDVAGDIYIADSGNNVVRRIAATTGTITTYAGNNTERFSGDGGPASQAGLYAPYAFALDTEGSLYIADVFHNRIRKVAANTALLQYPVIRVDRISDPLTQTLENDGNAPLNISKFNAVSNSQIDPNTTTCSLTVPLPTLAQCVVGVDFAPNTIGSTVPGELDVDSDAGNSPGIIHLSGQVLDVNPTTTTLKSGTNPSQTGAPVVFTVQVTNSGQTPTGTVTLLDGTTSIGTIPLVSGSGSLTISNLTGGSHSLTAAYGGDSQNAASTSTVLIQVVKDPQAETTTTLTANPTTSPAGASIAFTATVNIVIANAGTGAITGSVAIKQGGSTLGVGNINNATATGSTGIATIALTNLPVGTDSITAVYAGNSNYEGSTSPPIVETVQQATTQITLAPAVNPSFAGASLTLTAALTSNGGVPTGNVNFFDGTTLLGSAPINAQGMAILSAPGRFWTVATHTLTAVYNGDANDTASTSPPIAEVIASSPTSTTIASSLNPAGVGGSITFTAIVTTEGSSPTGSVQFFDGATGIGIGTLTGTGGTTGAATFTTSALALGTHTIIAVYAGDSLDTTSTSPTLSELIQPTTDGIALTSSANPAIYNSALVLTAQVTGTGAPPSGTVSLLDGGVSIASLPVPTNGTVSFVNPALAIGPHTLTASYSGDTNHGAVTSTPFTQNILQATSTTLAANSTSLIAGRQLTLTAVVAGASSKPLSGTTAGSVTFTDGTKVLGVMAPDSTGTAIFSISTLLPGQHTVTATYNGDSNDAASASSTLSISIAIATTTTALTTNANPIASGSSLTLTATVAGNGGTPAGTITFHDGGTSLTAVQVSGNGIATFSLSTLAPGIHQISATYSGDALDSPSTSSTIAEQIAEQTSVALTSSENPALLQDNVVLTVTVSNGAPSVPPSGTVTLTDGGSPLATLQLNASGIATYTMQSPSLGTHTLVASYAGDNENSPAASQPLTETVTLRPSATSFTASLTSISAGQSITLISIVQATGSRPATGTVTWSSGTTTLGSAAIDATGLATLNITPVQGVYNTVAQYSGDTLYAASASKPITITVGPTIEFTVNLTPASLSIKRGARATINISIASATTFADTLVMGCAGLPVDATCTFSRSQVPVSGGVAQALSVIVDTGDPLGAGSSARLNRPPRLTELCGLPLGALLALLVGWNRRKLRRMRPRLALLSLVLLLAAGTSVMSGCGSNLNVANTPAGSYTFQVIASGNKTGVTQTTTIALTVTQ